MIKSYSLDESQEWDKVVDTFPNQDIYYRSGYLKAFELNGDGVPMLIQWQGSSGVTAICALMLRDIALDSRFASHVSPNQLYDATTPYGYGGFIFDRTLDDDELSVLSEELSHDLQRWGRQHNIISMVMRLHPVLKNAREASSFMDVLPLGPTITIDLASEEIINANIISKNRNMIRKAEKSGVVIKHGRGLNLLSVFKEIYEETMRRDNATAYYFFDTKFYESIDRDLVDNYEIFYAEFEGKIISMAIMIYAGDCLNYHLSGSLTDYRHLASGNLLLRETAIWGCQKGFKTFHLGGGVGAGEDSLYKFKAAFNRNSNSEFALARLVIDQNRYDHLVELRKLSNDFDPASKFFPLYRS